MPSRKIPRVLRPLFARCYAARATILPHRVTRGLPVPTHIVTPDYASTGIPSGMGPETGSPAIKTPEEVEAMRAVCLVAAEARELAAAAAAPGVTTEEIDRVAHEFIVASGAYPSPLNYHSFPKSICTSVNEVLCHGIPDNRPLEDGDILNIDISTYMGGFHGDTSTMVAVGDCDPEALKLMQTTKDCLDAAISICRPGAQFSAIAKLIQKMASSAGFCVQPDFCGHGIGREFHEAPLVKHCVDEWVIVGDDGISMAPGMTFTIEPILVEGRSSAYRVWRDGWTAVTTSGGRSAQYEHTILITEDGSEVLTSS